MVQDDKENWRVLSNDVDNKYLSAYNTVEERFNCSTERTVVMIGYVPEIDKCDCNTIHESVVADVREHMPQEENLLDLAELFKVFGDSTRVKILCALFRAQMCVCDLAVLLGMTKSAVSHQLRILRQAKLVNARRDGKNVYYSLADEHVRNIFDQGLLHICED